MVLATSTKPEKTPSSRGLPRTVRGVAVVIEGLCLLVVCVGRIRRRWAGLIWVLNEVPAAAKHKLGPTAVQSEPRAPPDLLKHSPFYISAAARVCKLGQKRQNGSGVGLYLGCQGPECPNQHEKTETLPREGA